MKKQKNFIFIILGSLLFIGCGYNNVHIIENNSDSPSLAPAIGNNQVHLTPGVTIASGSQFKVQMVLSPGSVRAKGKQFDVQMGLQRR